MAHERMQTLYSAISLFKYNHFVGKQHTAHVHSSLPMVYCFTGNLISGKIRGIARPLFWQSSAPSTRILLHYLVFCLCDCRCLEITD